MKTTVKIGGTTWIIEQTNNDYIVSTADGVRFRTGQGMYAVADYLSDQFKVFALYIIEEAQKSQGVISPDAERRTQS